MTQMPPDWYPAPGEDGRRRWWDGSRWTDHYDDTGTYVSSPDQVAAAQQDAARLGKRRSTNKKILLAAGGVVALIVLLAIIGAIAGGGDDTTASDSPSPSTASKPTKAPSSAAATEATSAAPSDEPPAATTAPAAPKNPTDVAASAIRSLDRDVDLSSIALNRDQPKSMTVRFKVKDNLSKGFIRTGIGEDAFAVAQGALDSDVPFRVLWIQGTFPTSDKFGKTTDDSQVFQVRFTRATLERINFDDIVATSYDNLDDLAIGQSFFLLPDLRE